MTIRRNTYAYGRMGAAAAPILAMLASFAASGALAQTSSPEADDATQVEEIVVTGSYIARPVQDSSTPLSVLNSEEISRRGLLTTDELLKTLPSNGVSRSISDSIGSPYTAGTSQVNLRGFGLSSSLTLINGRRHVVAPAPDPDGASFVDINAIPLIMIDRLEVLQGGAAALYGSDAIAGVANFIMRNRFEGIELRAGSNFTTRGDDHRDSNVGVLGGIQGDRYHIVGGLEYVDRAPLEFLDRDFSTGRVITGTGSPGSFRRLTAPSVSLIDPNCVAAGGIARPNNPAVPSVGVCAADLSKYFYLIPKEQRISSYVTGDYMLGNGIKLYAEGGYRTTRIYETASPSYGILTYPIVPATNPGNLVENGGFGEPVRYFGRTLGASFDPSRNLAKLATYRAVIGASGDLAGTWRFDTSYTYSYQRTFFTNFDQNNARLIAALNCQGGPNNDLCFNPFGSALINPAVANSQAVLDDMARDPYRIYKSSLQSVDAVVTGEALTLPGGPMSLAIGGQFRHETLEFEADLEQQTQQLVNFFAGPSFDADRNVGAAFIEADLPLLENLDVQIAGRYEYYDQGIGGQFTPKAAVHYEPVDGLSLRASIGSSFRAPSLSQVTSISTIQTALNDPLNPSPVPFFSSILTVPNAALEPEESVNYNLGFVATPLEGLSFSADYFHYKYTDLISKENAQAIITADPLDPRIHRLGATGPIATIDVSFVNTRSVEADGIDLAADYSRSFGDDGRIAFTARATWLNSYEADIGLGYAENLVGLRNYENFADALPEWRASGTTTLTLGAHRLTGTVNFIDSVRENVANRTSPINGFKIDDFTTVDLQYATDIGDTGLSLSVGAQNVFDELPPAVALSSVELAGYERQLHDPRGRLVYFRLTARFGQ